ncbi:MAG: immunity 17 family protein [Planctomycetaceae bacterium]
MNPIGLLFIAVGAFAACGGIFNWEWYMNSRRARFFSAILSRTGARIFYVIVGTGIAVLGAMVTGGLVELGKK